MTTSTASRPDIDVAILGAGIAGTALAAVLARQGAKVQIFDGNTHPRFAIGESTIPYTSSLMRLVGQRYDVPELKTITTFHNVQAKITRNGGIKKGFGFVYHREGERLNTKETNELAIPRTTHMENHYFRQDLDAWLLNVAAKYGAKIKQQTRIADVDFDYAGATVIATDGSTWRARFVVDASGFRSPLALKFGLRETPSRLRHHSRSIFTHMIDVTPYERLFPPGTFKTFNTFSSGTLHHVFKGGWLWVIPFNNHPRATNPLVSIGLQLDPRIYPKDKSLTPEDEFWSFIERYPDIIRQFTGARAAREWVSTERIQYSPTQTIGYRWCLTSHAAGFIDPLFSRGMSNTFEIINALSWRLLDALRDDDFSVERFKPVQDLEQGQLDFNDNLVANAYTSFSDYRLWNAWFRIWVLSQGISTLRMTYTYAKLCQDRNAAAELAALERIAPYGALPDYEPLRNVYAEVSRAVRAVADGVTDAGTAADTIMEQLSNNAGPLSMGFDAANPDYRYFGFKYAHLRRARHWAKNQVPPEVGKIAYEEMPFLIRTRFSRKEFNPVEELKAAIAGRKYIGKWLRVPEPR